MSNVKTRTYQGGTLDEVLPKIREELGDDAIVVRQREGLKGGVGGFFQKRCVEVEARAGAAGPAPQAPATATGGFSVTDGPDVAPPGVTAPAPAASSSVAEAMLAQASSAGFGARLADAQQEQAAIGADAPPAPAAGTPSVDDLLGGVTEPPAAARTRVVTSPQVDALPSRPAAPEAAAEPAPVAQPAPAPEPVPEVRAVIPPPAPPAPPAPAPAPPAPASAAAAGRQARAERAIAGLADRGLSQAFAEEVVDGVLAYRMPLQPGARLGTVVARELARHIPVAPLARPGVTAWVGAGGSGKTSVAAAFARAHAEAGTLPVACVALQPADDGASLRAALEGAPVDVHVAKDDAVAEPLVQWLIASGATVVIDTPAVSPRNVAEIKALGRRLRRLGVEDVHLCIPATLSRQVAGDVLEAAGPLKPTALTITHGDETERLGGAVQLAVDAALPISYVSEAGSMGRGLRAADPVELAKGLVG